MKFKGVWRYLSMIMDLYSRRIISWSLDKCRTMEVTKRTLENAVKKCKPSGDLMLHTDRGVEYRGHVYQKVLKRHGIIHSLSRAGKCTDNAHMELWQRKIKFVRFIEGRSQITVGFCSFVAYFNQLLFAS